MFTMKYDLRSIEQLENDLDRFSERALPFAYRDTLNNAAFETSADAKRNLQVRFITRNKYTERSIRYKKVVGLKPNQMSSEAGSVQDYMRKQEEGFTESKPGTHGVAIPTSASANQRGVRPRTRVIQRRNWLNKINPPRVSSGPGAIVRAVQQAVSSGRRTIFLDRADDQFRRTTGFYRVIGGRKSKSGWPKNAKLELLYATDRPTIRVKERRWLEPAAERTMARFDEIYRNALIRQIEINRSFKNR